MLILVSGTKPELADPRYAPHAGHLTSPATGTRLGLFAETGLVWAADNDCFRGFKEAVASGAFARRGGHCGLDEPAWRRMVDRIRRDGPPGLKFLSLPDSVGNARETVALFDWFLEVVKPGADEGGHLPAGLVGQNGMEDCDWDWWFGLADAFFIGGDDEWKESRAAADLAGEAKRRGLWVHMGRVNTPRRLRVAYDMGCDSVDGTGFTWFTEAKLGPAVARLRRLHRRPPAGWRGTPRQALLFR